MRASIASVLQRDDPQAPVAILGHATLQLELEQVDRELLRRAPETTRELVARRRLAEQRFENPTSLPIETPMCFISKKIV